MAITQRLKIKILQLEEVVRSQQLRHDGVLTSFKNLEYEFTTLVKKNEGLVDDNKRMAEYIISLETRGKIKDLYGKKT